MRHRRRREIRAAWLRLAAVFLLLVAGAARADAALTVVPASAATAPRGIIQFVTTGGSGSGDVWTLAANSSGGAIEATTGVYTAGATGGVTDIIRVSDSQGNIASATVTVEAAITISPASPTTFPKGTVNFQANGGSNVGFIWSLAANASGATINPTTGVYKAGQIGGVVDVITVVDSLGNSATASVAVGPAMTIGGTPSLPPSGSAQFVATGGAGVGFAWSLSQNNSHGTISQSGVYTAGPIGSVTDEVLVTDPYGNTATHPITVTPSVSVLPAIQSTTTRGTIQFAADGGSGNFTWALYVNASGGTISAQGLYVAGAVGKVTDAITVTDSLGNVASALVSVGVSLSITPASVTVKPDGTVSFSASGGSDTGISWSLAVDGSGARIDAATGIYVAGDQPGLDAVQARDSLGDTAVTIVVVGQPNSAPLDAGTTPDAAVAPDAGSTADAGSAGPSDAGVRADAGAPSGGVDAGLPSTDCGPPPSSGRGCGVGGAAANAGGGASMALVCLLLAAVWLRRARRRWRQQE